MSSKAWYKPSSIPKLVARFPVISNAKTNNNNDNNKIKKVIEIWTTTCIVTNFGMQRGRTTIGGDGSGKNTTIGGSDNNGSNNINILPKCSTLINPANPNLSGPHTFPYFPKGGPQPEAMPNRPAHHIMGYVSQWGGMDVGGGMLFPAAAIDGLVHQLGGLRLRAECSLVAAHPHAHLYDNQQTNTRNDNATTIPTSAAIHQEVNNKNNKSNDSDALNIANDSVSNGKAKCPVGMAIATSPGGEELQLEYNRIIHTVPPFYNFPPSMTKELMQLLLKLDNRDDNIIGMVDEGVHQDTTKVPSSSWSEKLLRSCYRQSFELAFANSNGGKTGEHRGTLFDTVLSSLCLLITPSSSSIPSPESRRVAVPLLGAGCRGFPTKVALHVAAMESVAWLLSSGSCYHEGNIMADSSVRNDTSEQDNDNLDEMVIAFGLLEKDDAESLASKIGESLTSITCNRSQ